MKEELYYLRTAAEARVAELKEQGQVTAMYYSYRGTFIVKWKV